MILIVTANPILIAAFFMLYHILFDFNYSKVLLVFEGIY
jgi:hypothetical protein